jgi:hypothetical protein
LRRYGNENIAIIAALSEMQPISAKLQAGARCSIRPALVANPAVIVDVKCSLYLNPWF